MNENYLESGKALEQFKKNASRPGSPLCFCPESQ